MTGSWSYIVPMQVGVLGPLRVLGADGQIALAGAKERTVLAHLVARVGQVVPAEDLVDSLWPEEPPRTALRTLHAYVARLRSGLVRCDTGTGLVMTEGRGYRLALDPLHIDAHRFGHLVELGRSALAAGHARAAVETLGDALALWRGPAYAGFEGTVFGRAEGCRLRELQVAAREDWLAARFAAGEGSGVVPELEAHVSEHQLRERGWALLVRAHAATDHQAAALDALGRARRVLAEELGVDPGEELTSLQARVLAQDPSLRPRPQVPAALVPPPNRLIGHGTELSELEGHWREAAGGVGRRVVLLGEAGSGRWRVACELAARVASSGAEVVLGVGPAPGPVLRVVDARLDLPGTLPEPGAGELQLLVALAVPAGLVVDAQVQATPLSVEEVAQVLDAYALDGTDPDHLRRAAVEIHARSGGNVARVQGLAVRWARDAVADRVAERARRSRGTSMVHEVERSALADDVARWSTLGQSAGVDPGGCPWRGLASYQEQDAGWFAGRERLTAELVARVGADRALLLVGGSGSGKSSLLRAGLLAALAAGALPGSAGWVRLLMRPGEHPMRELTNAALAGAGATGPDRVADLLTRALDGRGGAERILLVVDQFEECWTVCADPGEREAFLATVADLAAGTALPVSVVLAVRADHAGALASHPGLAAVLSGRAVFVAPMGEAELRRVIERPAAHAGLRLDTGLADALVADTLAEPGGLPLLSTALADLWDRRAGVRLTLAGYVGSGGVGAAIAQMAERVFGELDEPHQGACRVLLRRLAGPGAGDAIVRRRVSLDELAALPNPLVRSCVEPLANARLLSVTDVHVEVAHEALFRSWPRLRDWMAEDAATRDLQRRLTAAVLDWDGDGREPVGLWSGARLAAAMDLVAQRPEEFTGAEVGFVQASSAHVDGQRASAEERARTTQRQNTRLRRLLAGLGITLTLALVAAGLAVWSGNEASEQRQTARAQRLAASAFSKDYLADRMLTAVEAVRTEESPETVGALLSVLDADGAVVKRIDTPHRLMAVGTAPGLTKAVVTANLEDLHLLDLVTGEDRVVYRGKSDNLGDVRLSPDGRYAALQRVSVTDPEPYSIDVVDLTTGQKVWSRFLGLNNEFRGFFGGFDFTDTPGELAVALPEGVHLQQVDGAQASRLIPWPWLDPQSGRLSRLSDNRVLVRPEQSDDPARIVDLVSGEVSEIQAIGKFWVAPDGHRVLSKDDVGTITLLDVDQLDQPPVPVPLGQDVDTVGWFPDGTGLVAGGIDGVVHVLDLPSAAVRESLTGHNGAVMGLAVAPDGSTAWAAGRDGDIIGLDLSGARRFQRSWPLPVGVRSGQASKDGLTALVWGPSTTGGSDQVAVLETGSRTLIGHPVPQPPDDPDAWAGARAGAISPDGRLLVAGVSTQSNPEAPRNDAARIVDVDSGDILTEVALPWEPQSIAVLPTGDRALVTGEDGVLLLALPSGRTLLRRDLERVSPWDSSLKVPALIEVSPDGRWAALSRGPRIVVVDTTTLEEVTTWELPSYDRTLTMQWVGGGTSLAYGGLFGTLSFRAVPSGHPVGGPTLVAPGYLLDLAASPDGTLLASLGTDGEVVLWDTATRQQVGRPLVPRSGDGWGWLRFTPDGTAVEVWYQGGRAVRYPIATATLIARACAIARREPTTAEWAAMHGSAPPHLVCGDLANRDLMGPPAEPVQDGSRGSRSTAAPRS